MSGLVLEFVFLLVLLWLMCIFEYIAPERLNREKQREREVGAIKVKMPGVLDLIMMPGVLDEDEATSE